MMQIKSDHHWIGLGAVSVAIWMSACRQVIKQSVSMFNDFVLHKIKATDPVEN